MCDFFVSLHRISICKPWFDHPTLLQLSSDYVSRIDSIDIPKGIEDVQSDEVQSTKVIKEGQVLILRNGKTYTMQGQEVK